MSKLDAALKAARELATSGPNFVYNSRASSQRVRRIILDLVEAVEGRSAVTTEEQINHMVNRFLGWRLPENFSSDGGISFKRTFNDHTAHPMNHEPVGTNLFDATQAEAMVRHMLDGLPTS